MLATTPLSRSSSTFILNGAWICRLDNNRIGGMGTSWLAKQGLKHVRFLKSLQYVDETNTSLQLHANAEARHWNESEDAAIQMLRSFCVSRPAYLPCCLTMHFYAGAPVVADILLRVCGEAGSTRTSSEIPVWGYWWTDSSMCRCLTRSCVLPEDIRGRMTCFTTCKGPQASCVGKEGLSEEKHNVGADVCDQDKQMACFSN